MGGTGGRVEGGVGGQEGKEGRGNGGTATGMKAGGGVERQAVKHKKHTRVPRCTPSV